jgi:hypothetical protein
MHRPDQASHQPSETEPSSSSARRLPTARAVFQPRNPAPEASAPLLPALESSSYPQTDTTKADHVQLSNGEYRVPILHFGREELIQLCPEDQTRIRQLTDLEIEALALEVEDVLDEIFRLTVPLVWAKFQTGVGDSR